MHKTIMLRRFMELLFDDPQGAHRAAELGEALLAARSLRLTEIATRMKGSMAAAYKRIQHFLRRADPRPALRRLFWEAAEFVRGDVTEVERPHAKQTADVGTLQDGKTKGFWILALAVPYRGRGIPVGVVTFSSRTIAQGLDSRNLNHLRAFAAVKEMLGERPLVLDREFSYLELLLRLQEEGVSFVIRLNSGRHPPKFYDEEGREVALMIAPGEKVTYPGIWYRGKVRVNVAGIWRKGLAEPLGVMTNLEPQQGLEIYHRRMKIEEVFRDWKSLLGLGRLMNKKQEYMEKMVALLLLVYAVGLLVGERLRDALYGESEDPPTQTPAALCRADPSRRPRGRKWRQYSGLFILLKQKWLLPQATWRQILHDALATFTTIVLPDVPTHVRT